MKLNPSKILDIYDFGKVKLQDVAVAPDKIRILGVGPLTASPSGLNPSKCRVEKRLIGICCSFMLLCLV